MVCPKCQSENVQMDTFQEQQGSKTITRTKSKYKEKGHGLLWWLFIGWWWWMVDLILWICFFIPRLVLQLFKKKKYVGTSTTVSKTNNRVDYKTVCVCHNCGHKWTI